MSWSVSAVGKAAAVAAKIAQEINAYKCAEPEEGVKQAAGVVLAAALAAQDPAGVVQVAASGSQSQQGTPPVFTNSLAITVTPIYGFVGD